MFQVRQATRQRRPLKISLEGLSGSGKTFTGLRLLFAMKAQGIGKKIAVADSENSSSELYSGQVVDGLKWEFDVLDLTAEHQNPNGYAQAYDYLCKQGYDLILMDSLSHAWYGALERVESIAAKGGRNDKFAGWGQVTPEQRNMMTTLTDNRANLVATMRVKTEYDLVEKNGKQVRQKVGLKVDQRDNTEYEFDMVLRLDQDHRASVEKVRGCTIMDGKHVAQPGPTFFQPLFDWWKSAPEAPAVQPASKQPEPTKQPEREPGDDDLSEANEPPEPIAAATVQAIDAALATGGWSWFSAGVNAKMSSILGRAVDPKAPLSELTADEGQKVRKQLDIWIAAKAKQPKKAEGATA